MMRDLKTRKLDRPKLQLHKLLQEQGAWNGYPICTFKHENIYKRKTYKFKGHIIGVVVDGDFKQHKILTDDGKTWHKHKVLDEVQIIKPDKIDE